MQAEEFTNDLFENSVPSFVGPELDRVYQNLYSSLPTLTVYGKISAGTSTYVARRNGAIVAVLLFRRERN